MYWKSLSDFLAMGTHGLYVWGSVLGMALLMLAEPLLLVRGRKTLLDRLRRQFRAEQDETVRARVAATSHPPEN